MGGVVFIIAWLKGFVILGNELGVKLVDRSVVVTL
jgi:hypothetical protein